ncbi:PAAR-like protein [uncultured Flavobacterium sp.]|uniref:PAAR-like protein n=1 Tax=uncultured Flavobacterium sp. TaxID=165435 RepID=UPI00292F0A8C|nr:PAAR-like protein [uncultured Flavobacterium sp.]
MAKPDNTLLRKQREEKQEAKNGLKFVIDGAKIRCHSCTIPEGDLKANYDTPSIQDKRVVTVVENDMTSLIFKGNCKKSFLSSSPCASVMKLGEWKNPGTVYFQDELAVLLRSTIKCEYGGVDITIWDCGQRNEITNLNTLGAPIPNIDRIININGHFYNKDGTFEGKINESDFEGSVNDVYVCDGKSTQKDKNGNDLLTYNNTKLLKENDENITHSDFCYIAYVVKMEAGGNDFKELKCIAYSSFNYSKNETLKKNGKSKWKQALAGTYSSVPGKEELLEELHNEKDKLTRKALFYVLTGEEDLTNGATFWDGTDFLAWGDSEMNIYNKLGSNKFDDFKFIEIPKDVYDSYLSANGTSIRYPIMKKYVHDTKNDKGTHEDLTKKMKKQVKGKDGKDILDKDGKPTFEMVDEPSGVKYKLPASDFDNQNYWKSGSFYYKTDSKETYGISGTISAGKSIFWKKTKIRLTSEISIKK